MSGRASEEMQFPLGSGCSRLPNHLRGILHCLVTLHVLQLGSAQLKVVGPGHPLTATVGQDIVLPCQLSPSSNAQRMDVRWIRYQTSETVHHYWDGEDLYVEQMREYRGRTELSHDGLSRGSLDLQILRVRPSDDGMYFCTVQSDAGYAEAVVELDVAAVGLSPLVSLEGYRNGGIQVACRSSGWFPEPEVLWKDPRGQRFPSASQRGSRDERGLFEIEHSVTVTGEADGNLSCVVRNSRLGQEKQSSLHISAPFFHDAHPWKVALAVMLVFLLMSILGLIVFGVRLLKKTEKQSRDLEEKTMELEARNMELAWRRLLFPVDKEEISLDPDTAHPRLVLSEDCRSVRCGEKKQDLPNNSRRFTDSLCVLGREGFTGGRHCWEVEGEVGAEAHWAVGVAKASLSRKREIELRPMEGIWAVQHRKGRFEAFTFFGTRIPLSLSPVPRRIWVCLDCTGQQVTFVNADNGAEIFTFQPAAFNCEKIHPWFFVAKGAVWLCPSSSTPPKPSPPPTSSAASEEASCPSPDPACAPLLGAAGAAAQLGSAQSQGAARG